MNNCSNLNGVCHEYNPHAIRGSGPSIWGKSRRNGLLVWKWTMSCRTEEEGGAGKSSSLNSSWRDGGAERVCWRLGKLCGTHWPAGWEQSPLSWNPLRSYSWRFRCRGCVPHWPASWPLTLVDADCRLIHAG